MLLRINRLVLTLAAALLLVGCVVAVGMPHWEAETVLRAGRHARVWRLLVLALAAVPLLSWAAHGALHLLRRRRVVWGGLAASAWLVVTANLLFWGLVEVRFAPVERLFETGRIVWVGQRVLLFGHGYWKLSDGYWQHQTVVSLPDGDVYRGPTLDLLLRLRREGAAGIWGSWCYTGNFPYIRKDLVSGRRVPWPSFASYNTSPGITIPIWLGSAFFRVGWPEGQYLAEPEPVSAVVPDTLILRRPSERRIERAFVRLRGRHPDLPWPDSVSWRPTPRDTVRVMPRRLLRALPPEEQQAVEAQTLVRVQEKTRTAMAVYWVRGRAFPVYVRIPPRLRRMPDPRPLRAEASPPSPRGHGGLPGEGTLARADVARARR